MARVFLEDIAKTYGDVVAVEKLTLEVRDKEFLVLVGPSGCGKTTTLRMVAGLEEATEGDIFIGADLVNDLDPKDRNIAMVFQNYALYPHMTVQQNMAFSLKMRRTPRAEIDKRVKEAAQFLGLEDLLQRTPKQLSGGQKQRVAVGRAVVRQPDVFLFDEPLSNLDAKLRVDMREELAKLHRRLNATIIYVTHDQVEAMTLGDRIVVMKDGRVQQVGSPKEVYYQPATKFVASFIGSPPMNFFPGTLIVEDSGAWLDVVGSRLKLPDDKFSTCAENAGREVAVGIRPEDISETPPSDGLDHARAKILADVEVIETLGPEAILGLSLKGHTFRARVDPDTRARIGDRVELFFSLEKIRVFDSETEGAIH